MSKPCGPHPVSRRGALATLAGSAALATGSGSRGRAQTGTPEAPPAAAAPNPVVASWPHVFQHPEFQFQFLIGLGGTYEQAADVGELLAAASQIADGDYDSWYDTFVRLGDRVRAMAETSEAGGAAVSAREAWLRASSYYGQAYFFTYGTREPDRIVATWEQHRACFDHFAALLQPAAEHVTIPYEQTTLPGYVLRVDDRDVPRPWLIMNNGSDGTATDMWVQGAAAGLRRGYNVLIFDGPGQGAALWRQRLYFRPDWEAVITPIVDWLLERPDVDPDKLVLLGVSQAGYWVPRALAFEHRIAVAVADPGVMDVATSWAAMMPPGTMEGLLHASDAERTQIATELNQGVEQEMAHDVQLRFTVMMRMAPFGTKTLADMLVDLAAYNLNDVVGQITTPLLIADPEGESFWPGQSQQLYDALPGRKALVRFTAAEGADLHCEPKAKSLRAQRFFEWFDQVIRGPATTPTAGQEAGA
jgi:hypothetical protein